MVDKLDLDRLRGLVEAASPLPWVYRPEKYDDWGWIRGVERDDRGIGPFRPIVANAKDSLVSDEDMDAHRRAGTDPYSPNAELIVTAVNLIPTLLANAATPANGEQVEPDKLKTAYLALLTISQEDDGPLGRYAAKIARAVEPNATPAEDARERVRVLEEALRDIAETQMPTARGVDHSEWTAGAFDEFQAIARTALGNKETDRHG